MNYLQKIKELLWPAVVLVLIVAAVLGIVAVKSLYRYQASLQVARTITVSGTAKTAAIPDIATFNFSVVSEGKEPAKISDENAKKINKAIDYVKSQSVDAKDIKTSGYNLQPKYEYDEKFRRSWISGYTLTQTVDLKIRNFDKISPILASLPSMGINQISSLSFSIDNQDQYLELARKEAFDKAYKKAKEMARQNHVRLGKVVTFYESGNNNYPTPYYAKAEAFGMGGDSIAAPSIEAGSQELTVNVSVTYEIR